MDHSKLKDNFLHGWTTGQDTICGPGSTISGCRSIYAHLPLVLETIRHSLSLGDGDFILFNDCGCGDLNWQRPISWRGLNVDYMGYDIVSRPEWSRKTDNFNFQELDIIKSPMRDCHVSWVRDVFIHFPNEIILETLENLSKNSKYILVSTQSIHPQGKSVINSERDDIFLEGEMKPDNCARYNLSDTPFNFPKPLLSIPEPQFFREIGLWKFI
jgi:hypothetical protein